VGIPVVVGGRLVGTAVVVGLYVGTCEVGLDVVLGFPVVGLPVVGRFVGGVGFAVVGCTVGLAVVGLAVLVSGAVGAVGFPVVGFAVVTGLAVLTGFAVLGLRVVGLSVVGLSVGLAAAVLSLLRRRCTTSAHDEARKPQPACAAHSLRGHAHSTARLSETSAAQSLTTTHPKCSEHCGDDAASVEHTGRHRLRGAS